MGIAASRPEFFRFENGAKAPLPFSPAENERRIDALRRVMGAADIPAVLLTSMQNVACFSGFLYCSFGRSYALVVTADRCTTVSANIDVGQPWRRSHGDNLAYTDWKRGNFWRAVRELVVAPGRLGIETDHFTHSMRDQPIDFLGAVELVDIGAAIRDAVVEGAREFDVAMAGRDAIERGAAGNLEWLLCRTTITGPKTTTW